MARLTAAQRKALPASAFAGPHRSYPVNDASHARNALARVAQFGSSTEKAKVRSKVSKRYPGIGGKSSQKARDAKVAMFVKGKPGNKVTEDSPGWNPYTMGNKRGHLPSSGRKGRTIPYH